jgi:hypothetical protein
MKYSAAPAAISSKPNKPTPRKSKRAPRGKIQYGIATVQNPGTRIVKTSVRNSADIATSVHLLR